MWKYLGLNDHENIMHPNTWMHLSGILKKFSGLKLIYYERRKVEDNYYNTDLKILEKE